MSNRLLEQARAVAEIFRINTEAAQLYEEMVLKTMCEAIGLHDDIKTIDTISLVSEIDEKHEFAVKIQNTLEERISREGSFTRRAFHLDQVEKYMMIVPPLEDAKRKVQEVIHALLQRKEALKKSSR